MNGHQVRTCTVCQRRSSHRILRQPWVPRPPGQVARGESASEGEEADHKVLRTRHAAASAPPRQEAFFLSAQPQSLTTFPSRPLAELICLGIKTMQQATQLQLSGQCPVQFSSTTNLQDKMRSLGPQLRHEPSASRGPFCNSLTRTRRCLTTSHASGLCFRARPSRMSW